MGDFLDIENAILRVDGHHIFEFLLFVLWSKLNSCAGARFFGGFGWGYPQAASH